MMKLYGCGGAPPGAGGFANTTGTDEAGYAL